MTPARQALERAEGMLRWARVPDAGVEAEFLLASVLGVSRVEARLTERPLTVGEAARLTRLLAARARRHPLAYVLGTQPFLDLTLSVGPGVLVPRPETEELALAAIAAARAAARPRVLDLCTGSGAIALAVAAALPAASVTGTDRSAAALAWARRNARRLGLKVEFRRGDLFAAVRGRFDVIVSNPPYLPTARLPRLAPEVQAEPKDALDGGPRGLSALLRIVRGASRHLAPGGRLLLELDPGQARTVAAALRAAGFAAVAVRKDLQGRDRIVEATWTA